jgi:hypothetical protein|tara:strand:- start:147 stop:419 length:273 start_codon:yes stop_codon:yes gene_type:complete
MKKRETPNTVSFNKRPTGQKKIGESGDEFYSSNGGEREKRRKSKRIKKKKKKKKNAPKPPPILKRRRLALFFSRSSLIHGRWFKKKICGI